MSDTVQSLTPEPNFAAFVALDWGDEKHCWKLQEANSRHCRQGELPNKPEALEAWVADVRQRFGDRPIAVCVEQSRGALIYQLLKFPNLVIYAVHPLTAARFREALHPSGSKSDPADTAVLLDLLMQHRDRLRRLAPDTAETRQLQFLVEQRRLMVDEKTAWSNRLTQWLKLYFPQPLEWIDDIDSPMGCDLLSRWPTLHKIQSANPATLAKFFRQHNSRSEDRINERIQAIYAAKPAHNDPAMMTAGPQIVQEYVRLIRALQENIKELDQQIEALTDAHPEKALFEGLPGAGPALLPRLIIAFGTNRDRFASASELQAYSGIAPVTERSGQTKFIHFRKSCPKFLRQTFHEFARCSLAKCEWARAYYNLQREKQKGHHAAIRALAFKWIRVLFGIWKRGIRYDEQAYLRALDGKSHLTRVINTQLTWKSVAGFKKLAIAQKS